MASRSIRKIIHIDMDAFTASVEQRDDASLRGRPVAQSTIVHDLGLPLVVEEAAA